MYFAKSTRIPAQDYLYQQGESSPELFHIRTGIVCLESVNERGDRCITHLLGQGAVLGHETLLRQPRGFDARVCTDAVVEVITVSSATDPTQKISLMQWANAAVSRLLFEATQFKVQLHGARADEKVLLLIEQLKKLHPEKTEVCWLPSRYEMADILDINHATASRVIARLFRDGALQRTASRDFVRVDWAHIRTLLSST
ncbi:Crp/Fnr family transcriptional regulator [Hydrogenophaga sp. OTU3427]|uniref:Crp/Fnr family transcriptional regulator n=1 Tax=Hydrogenophaga sp. OTU3427 TaxID=3043856 RepID=UPI00313ED375